MNRVVSGYNQDPENASQFAFLLRQPMVVTPSPKSSRALVTAPRFTFMRKRTSISSSWKERVLYGDKTFDATAGTVVSLAWGIPHAWGNPTDTPLRMVITSTPGGVEEVLRLIATSVDQLDLAALANWPSAIGGLRTESTRGVTEMSHKGFSHIGLSTLDLDKTREFYEGVLGFKAVVADTINVKEGGRLRHMFFDVGRDQLIAFL